MKMDKNIKSKYLRKCKRYAKEVAKCSCPIMLENVLDAVSMDILDSIAFGYELTLDDVKVDILHYVPVEEMSGMLNLQKIV